MIWPLDLAYILFSIQQTIMTGQPPPPDVPPQNKGLIKGLLTIGFP